MIKRTLYFGNPAYLCKKLEQMIFRLPLNLKDAIALSDGILNQNVIKKE